MKTISNILFCAITMLFLGGSTQGQNKRVHRKESPATTKDSLEENLRIIDSNVHEIKINEDWLRYKDSLDHL